VPRKTRWAAGRRKARKGSSPMPGSRHRGSVGGHPGCGGRAACPPVPSDSPSWETHEGARRPALYVGTSARLALAPCAPFLRLSPIWGTTLRSSGTNAIQRSTHSEPGLDECMRGRSGLRRARPGWWWWPGGAPVYGSRPPTMLARVNGVPTTSLASHKQIAADFAARGGRFVGGRSRTGPRTWGGAEEI
jgi:hypothetical protein